MNSTLDLHKPFTVRWDSWLGEYLVISALTGQTLFHCSYKPQLSEWLREHGVRSE
jgi:hypothetical protein